MIQRFRCLGAVLLAGALSAQVPTGSLVVVDWFSAGPFGANQFWFVDPAGGGATEVYGVTPFGSPPINGVACGASNGAEFFCVAPTIGTLNGIQRVPMNAVAQPGVVDGSAWSQLGGERIRIVGSDVYTLAAGVIERSPLAGGPPVVVVTESDAVDIATDGTKLWIACGSPLNPTVLYPLIEHDLQTAQQRTVGLFAGLNRIALDPTGPRLLLGLAASAMVVDIATGNVLTSQVTGNAVVAVCYTLQGDAVIGESLGLGYTIHRLGAVQPLHSHSLASLSDLDVARAVTPSAVPFAAGCGNGGGVQWNVNGLPQLGNSSFRMSITGGGANTLALLFLGGSRTFSSLHGTLPLELTAYGAPGCNLLVDPQVPLLFPLDATGAAGYTLPIPASSAFVGTEWSAQAFVEDPSFSPYLFAGSPGLAFTINP